MRQHYLDLAILQGEKNWTQHFGKLSSEQNKKPPGETVFA